MSVVTWFDSIEAASTEAAGGKGASLARLAQAGFAVPPGFVISPGAASHPEGEAWASIADAADSLLTSGAVAVRSSALDEDSEAASFAGQHLTVLDVTSVEGAREAIAACVASLGGESARAYRERAGGGEGQMAVVVQRMVEARWAGVAFTADPATGDAGRIVVEAVHGKGEALVSGQAAAHRVVLAREGLAVLDEDTPGAPVMSHDEAREVAQLALRAEELFGSPQDIEFAFDGKLWILQSRPITTGAATTDGGWMNEFDSPTAPDDYWTSANVQEVLPGLLTPLTMTLFARATVVAYTMGYQRMKLLREDEWPQFVGMFYNRAYLNIGTTRMVAERALGGSGDALEHRFLGGEDPGGVRMRHTRELWGFRIRSLIPALRMVFGIYKAADRVERETMAWQAKVRRDDPSKMSGPDLEARRRELMDFVSGMFTVHLQASGMASSGFDMVAGHVRRVLGEASEGTLPALFTGMRGVESAQIGMDLWDLSRVAIATGVAGRLREPGFDPADAALPADWRASFRAFIERHGHRGLNEMEPAVPNWRQDPAPVVGMVASYVDLAPEHSPPAMLERQERERLALTEDLAKKIGRWRSPMFRRQLRWAQGWVALRERTKSISVRAARLSDYYTPRICELLVQHGAVDRADDLFFLTDEELRNFLFEPADGHDFRAAVTRRRRELERNRHIRLPERFHGHPVPLPPDTSAAAGAVLRGTPVSPGTVTGRARVVFDPREDTHPLPGEVLVAPVTDAGWTPLFALASGLVVDMGSALSHGSTVAREYGLPAVVNVHDGTTRIRSGDLIVVDGSAGTVTVLETAEAQGAASTA